MPRSSAWGSSSTQTSAHTGLLWLSTLLETALVISLNLGCFFLYVREHKRVADLYDTAETQSRRSSRLEAILALSDTLRPVRDVQEVVDIAAGAVKETLAFRECALYLYDEDEDVLHTRAALGGDDAYNEVIRERPIPARVVRGVLREEFRRGNVYFVDHATYSWTEEELFYFPPGEFEERVAGGFHPDDALFVPLLGAGGQLLGLFDLYDPEDGRVPSDEALQVLEIFANVTAASLENARYAAELEVRAVTDGLTGLFNHRHFQEIAGGRGRARRALRAGLHAADDGPRPLQERQRPPRPPARRRSPEVGGRGRSRRRARRRTSRRGTAGRSSS